MVPDLARVGVLKSLQFPQTPFSTSGLCFAHLVHLSFSKHAAQIGLATVSPRLAHLYKLISPSSVAQNKQTRAAMADAAPAAGRMLDGLPERDKKEAMLPKMPPEEGEKEEGGVVKGDTRRSEGEDSGKATRVCNCNPEQRRRASFSLHRPASSQNEKATQ
jgi:hypothetical protein